MSHIMLDSFYTYNTYSGCLSGHRPAKFYVQKAVEWSKKNWGERKILIIDPVISKSGMIPEKTCIAWLTSFVPIEENNHGSELIVIWFSQNNLVNSLNEALAHVEKCGGWNKNAVDWCI